LPDDSGFGAGLVASFLGAGAASCLGCSFSLGAAALSSAGMSSELMSSSGSAVMAILVPTLTALESSPCCMRVSLWSSRAHCHTHDDLGQDAVVLCFHIHLCLVRFDFEENIAGDERITWYASVSAVRRVLSHWLCRTFLQLPLGDVALGHRRRKRGHVEVLRRERGLSGVECYPPSSVVIVSSGPGGLPLREPWLRSCWEAARAESLHAAAIKAMDVQFVRTAAWGVAVDSRVLEKV
jgi:hypothetical protein